MAEQQQEYDVKSYTALIGLAEYFRSCQPPKIRECIHCLQASLNIGLPALLDAKVRLNIGNLLLLQTNNLGHARSHLQQALQVSQCLSGPEADEVFFESASLLAKFCSEQNQTNLSKNILRSALERSVQSNFFLWHYRLIFKLAGIHAEDKEVNIAIELLSAIGELTAEQNGHDYIRLLFTLSKGMLLLAIRQTEKFESLIPQTDSQIDAFQSEFATQRETLHVFWNLLKSYYFLYIGQPKTGKASLKSLQQRVQLLTTINEEEYSTADPQAIHWMTKDQICVLVYLVTVGYSMHTGYLDKAVKYTEKALAQIEKIRAAGNGNRLVTTFQLSLMEHAIMCKIVNGKGSFAIQELGLMCHLCKQDANKMDARFRPVFHTLMGLYGMSMNLMSDAAEHFKKAIQLSNQGTEVFCISALNLAIVYARAGESKKQELTEMFEQLNNKSVARSQALQAGYLYVKGLVSFFDSNYQEAKKYLRETLRLGNAEDLNRMTACALVLLGHVVTASGNAQEALSMVLPAMQLAAKVPDVYLQLWSASLVKDIYHLLGDESHEIEGAQLHHLYTTQLLQDHFQAGQRPEHTLLKDVNW